MSSASRRAEAQDPSTSSERLAQLAAKHRDLWPLIASHPSADEEVLGWLAQRGDDDLRAIIAGRGSEPEVDQAPVVGETAVLADEATADETVQADPVEEALAADAPEDVTVVDETPAVESADGAPVDSASDETPADDAELPRDETEPDSWLHEIGMTHQGDVEDKKGSGGKILAAVLLLAVVVIGIVLFATAGDDDDEEVAEPTATATTEAAEPTDEPTSDPSPTPSSSLTPADFCTTARDVNAAQIAILDEAAAEDSVALADFTNDFASLETDYRELSGVAPAELQDAIVTLADFFGDLAARPADATTAPTTDGLVDASTTLEDYFEVSCPA